MSRWSSSETEFYQKLVIARYHPEFRALPLSDALHELNKHQGWPGE